MQRRVLLVEDEQAIADILSLHLADIGATVTHAQDGIRGMTLALQNKWDLIMLDLSLPRLDGLLVCEQLRTSCPATPVMLVTARTSEA